MASTQQIRGRIKSVRNTRQITKAMQMVSASKLRRLQAAVEATQAYSKYARELLTYLKAQNEVGRFDFYKERPVKRRLMIVVSSDRGLAGAYNSNVFKRFITERKADKAAGIDTPVIVVGRQGAGFLSRLKDTEVIGAYTNLPDSPTMADLDAAVYTAIDQFRDGTVDAVDVISTEFINTISQRVVVRRLLPAGFVEEPVREELNVAAFEPSIEEVLEKTTVRLVESQVLQSVLESSVSEQAMRMMAMKSATDNATTLLQDYTLAYNNARQAAITQELAEISGGVEAMQ